MKQILKKVVKDKSLKRTNAEFQKPFLKKLLEDSKYNYNSFVYNLSSFIQADNFQDFQRTERFLDTDIQYIKGVGPKRALQLKSRGIFTVEHLLKFIPHSYRDFSKIKSIKDTMIGETVCLKVQYKFHREVFYNKKKVLEAVFYDSTGEIVLKWFNYKVNYHKKYFIKNKYFFVYGKAGFFNFQKEVVHPVIEPFEEVSLVLHPVYSSVGKIPNKTLKEIISNLIEKLNISGYEYLPFNIVFERGLKGITETFSDIHFPENIKKADKKRLIYDEFFFTMLGIVKERIKKEIIKTEPVAYKGHIIKPFVDSLPFKLTISQRKVLKEIFTDFKNGKVLNRLLQGDVGSGKTLVALITALLIVENKGQVAFMVPTEVLAEQHYRNFLKFSLPINIALLTSSTSKKNRRNILEGLANGDIDLVIGTHALIVENVSFNNLRLNIIDEQHKFGVKQRLFLKEKGENVHTLIMTATPIPRTLTLTLYGDLDVSVIDKCPPNRKRIKTFWFRESEREKFLNRIKDELLNGSQAYFIYPLIDESDKIELKSVSEMEEFLRRYFSDFKVKALHGKMKPKEKESIMSDFAKGNIDVLISTTVIEVGIDVPNATVIIIENAERFGLSQLHQLRGRVGRGDKQSYCFLISKDRVSKEAYERLKVMVSTNDGFKISEADLKIRGSGEIAGTKQSGIPEFQFADLIKDFNILLEAKKDAEELVKFDNSLEKFPCLKIKFEKFMKGKTELLSTG